MWVCVAGAVCDGWLCVCMLVALGTVLGECVSLCGWVASCVCMHAVCVCVCLCVCVCVFNGVEGGCVCVCV